MATSTLPLAPDDGLPSFVLDGARAVSEHVEVMLLAPGAPGAPDRELWDGLEVRRFPYFWPRGLQRLAYGDGMPENLRRSPLTWVQGPALMAAAARAVERLAAQWRADVVHSHWALPTGLASAWARGRPRRFAHAITLHGGDSYLLAAQALRPLARWIDWRCDAWIAASSNLRENLDRALGAPSGAELLPVGVDTAFFRSARPHPGALGEAGFLLFAGRLVEIKGLDVLLRALPAVRAAHPGLGLAVLGAGPLEGALREQARALGLTGAVRFCGRAGRAEVAAQLRACRAAVVPSIVDVRGRSEGMPAVVLEALAAGAVLVASDSGGIPDVVRNGHNGWLARAGDPEALARALCRALDSAPPPGAEATASAHDWSRTAERQLAIYERALGSAP